MPEEFATLQVNPDKTIYFFSVVPIYRQEMQLKLDHGTEALLDRLDRANVTELIDPRRKNVCAGLFGLF